MAIVPSASTGLPVCSFNRSSPKVIGPPLKPRQPFGDVDCIPNVCFRPFTPMAKNPFPHDTSVHIDPTNLIQSFMILKLAGSLAALNMPAIQQYEQQDLVINKAEFEKKVLYRFRHYTASPEHYDPYKAYYLRNRDENGNGERSARNLATMSYAAWKLKLTNLANTIAEGARLKLKVENGGELTDDEHAFLRTSVDHLEHTSRWMAQFLVSNQVDPDMFFKSVSDNIYSEYTKYIQDNVIDIAILEDRLTKIYTEFFNDLLVAGVAAQHILPKLPDYPSGFEPFSEPPIHDSFSPMLINQLWDATGRFYKGELLFLGHRGSYFDPEPGLDYFENLESAKAHSFFSATGTAQLPMNGDQYPQFGYITMGNYRALPIVRSNSVTLLVGRFSGGSDDVLRMSMIRLSQHFYTTPDNQHPLPEAVTDGHPFARAKRDINAWGKSKGIASGYGAEIMAISWWRGVAGGTETFLRIANLGLSGYAVGLGCATPATYQFGPVLGLGHNFGQRRRFFSNPIESVVIPHGGTQFQTLVFGFGAPQNSANDIDGCLNTTANAPLDNTAYLLYHGLTPENTGSYVVLDLKSPGFGRTYREVSTYPHPFKPDPTIASISEFRNPVPGWVMPCPNSIRPIGPYFLIETNDTNRKPMFIFQLTRDTPNPVKGTWEHSIFSTPGIQHQTAVDPSQFSHHWIGQTKRDFPALSITNTVSTSYACSVSEKALTLIDTPFRDTPLDAYKPFVAAVSESNSWYELIGKLPATYTKSQMVLSINLIKQGGAYGIFGSTGFTIYALSPDDGTISKIDWQSKQSVQPYISRTYIEDPEIYCSKTRLVPGHYLITNSQNLSLPPVSKQLVDDLLSVPTSNALNQVSPALRASYLSVITLK